MRKDDFIWAISMIAAILIAYTLIEITVALGAIKTFVFVMSVFWLNTFIRLNEHEIERKKKKEIWIPVGTSPEKARKLWKN